MIGLPPVLFDGTRERAVLWTRSRWGGYYCDLPVRKGPGLRVYQRPDGSTLLYDLDASGNADMESAVRPYPSLLVALRSIGWDVR